MKHVSIARANSKGRRREREGKEREREREREREKEREREGKTISKNDCYSIELEVQSITSEKSWWDETIMQVRI